MAVKQLIRILIARRVLVFAVASGFLLGFFAGRILTDPYAELLDHELSRYSKGQWIVRIDDDAIGADYLNERAELYARRIAPRADPLFRDRLLRKLVDNHIAVKAAKKSGILAGENARRYLWVYIEEAIAGYYLDAMADLGRKPVSMSGHEIDEFYKKHTALFAENNIPREKALEMIRSGLNELTHDMSARDRTIVRRIELGRLKVGKKIILNHTGLAGTGVPGPDKKKDP